MQGRTLSLFARRNALLDDVADAARERGAAVFCFTGDVTDATAVNSWYGEADERQPIDLTIANAGIFDGHAAGARLETNAEVERLVATNLLGAIYTAQAAMPAMMARRSGQIAFVSSLRRAFLVQTHPHIAPLRRAWWLMLRRCESIS